MLSMSETLHSEPIIGTGINMDVSVQGSDVKYQHRPEYFDALKDAGFQTVRWFIDPSANPAHWEGMIRDALERDLIAVPVLWADGSWSPEEFAAYWEKFALYYKDYPNDRLIFELLNEPDGVGLRDKDRAMKLINAAIPAIRKSNPNRILAIGGPGFNEAENLTQYVTPEYLDYQLEDYSGFEEDRNIVGVFHMYLPYYFSHYHGSYLKAGWKDIVRRKLEEAVFWSEKWDKSVLLTEWGAWGPPCNFDEEFYAYIKHIVDECNRLDIEWIYYCGYMNNQWAFSILNADSGWNQQALDILTGVKADSTPPLSPLLNSEFNAGTRQWKTRGPVKISDTFTGGLSGSRALEIEFLETSDAAVYQENLGDELGRKEWSKCSRSLITLTKNRPYQVSFMAKSSGDSGSIKIGLEYGPDNSEIWTSETITISSKAEKYTLSYTPSEDIENVRFLILSDSKRQTVYIDKIELKKSSVAPDEGD
jgi:hypothetical protein